ncbi:MAG TPA: hypothetical protein VET46_16000 [Steroidobacteraceae bacterium]|nr:hypothetical protein [Steroidobacteraceae bacterium]
MLRVNDHQLSQLEAQHPGIREEIYRLEDTRLPRCPHCESADTAHVIVGAIGRTIGIATATSKVALVPNDKAGAYRCNACHRFFD